MEQEDSGVPVVDIVLRLILLLSSAVVAGTSLARPSVGSLSWKPVWIVWVGGVSAAFTALLTVPLAGSAVPLAFLHAVLALAAPAAVVLPAARQHPPIARSLGGALGILLCAEVSVRPGTPMMLIDVLFTGCCVGWLGMTVLAGSVPAADRRSVRAGRLAVGAALGMTLASAVRLLTSGIAFDRRLRETGYGLILLVVVVCGVMVVISTGLLVRTSQPWRAYRVGSIAVVVALLCSATLPAMALPPEPPTPGVPILAHEDLGGHTVPLLVSPHRPGRNLVHFPDSAGQHLTVRSAGGTAQAHARPGTRGTWAEVQLQPGRGELVIGHGDVEDSVEVDTGTASGPARATSAQGPECASAALGALLAGGQPVLSGCPSDWLPEQDADALRKLAGFITANGARSVSVVTDDSPRSRQAADVVRTARSVRDTGTDVRVNSRPGRGDALLVVSGWDTAGRSLDAIRTRANNGAPYRDGVYLAPWLSSEPILNSVATSFVPLRFDPRENRSLRYGMTLSSSFGGEPPSVAGFRRWLSALGQPVPGQPGPGHPETGQRGAAAVSVYAAAQVDVMKMTMPDMPEMGMHGSPSVGQWNPRGTIVAISGALP